MKIMFELFTYFTAATNMKNSDEQTFISCERVKWPKSRGFFVQKIDTVF